MVTPRTPARALLIWAGIVVVLSVVVYALFRALMEPTKKEPFALYQDQSQHAVQTIQLAEASTTASNSDMLQMGRFVKSVPGPNPPVARPKTHR